MPTIGFWELLVLGVIALLVVGPERLPGLIRQVSAWVGVLRRTAREAQVQIEDEMNRLELKKLRDEDTLKSLREGDPLRKLRESEAVRKLQEPVSLEKLLGESDEPDAKRTAGDGQGAVTDEDQAIDKADRGQKQVHAHADADEDDDIEADDFDDRDDAAPEKAGRGRTRADSATGGATG